MLILPAIDLCGGRVVRLLHGRFDAETAYGDDPEAQARAFATVGAEWIHVVDLDGARDGALRQTAALASLASHARIQAGGGVRSRADVDSLLAAGVARVVVGSLAASEPDTVACWLSDLGPERLTIALDVSTAGPEPEVLLRGWTQGSGLSLWAALDRYPPGALLHLLVTDVARDGAMTGPNLPLMRAIRARRPDLQLQASGGVGRLADLTALREASAAAAIVGRALYEGAFTLEEALAC
ncbi:MAG: 1-(5-phosphoribosyl)-5-[(5-phosphoribosylamino)methylideneamino] imidazole-4-carboxamide isomerase [Sphingomonadaceae bacterium]|nr:1-(5-phosphoribosyl)-5-[(5-phosphoribosylamino)methylideneamino] imidazole-4-carboxamide isomerase [Sphingomonadaceae bacterium]